MDEIEDKEKVMCPNCGGYLEPETPCDFGYCLELIQEQSEYLGYAPYRKEKTE